MPKKCKAEGCNNRIWSKGFCLKHQYLREDKKAIETRERNKIPKQVSTLYKKKKSTEKSLNSLKKKIRKKQYPVSRKEFIQYKKSIGEYRCIFCGIGFEAEPDIHHLFGRDGDLLVWSGGFELAHRFCHIKYHGQSVHKIWWWEDYLERIKLRFFSLYEREILKKEK